MDDSPPRCGEARGGERPGVEPAIGCAPQPGRATVPSSKDYGNALISRRSFLSGAFGGAAYAYIRPGRLAKIALPRSGARLVNDTSPATGTNPVTGELVPDLVISAEREADLVLLDFAFFGFELKPGTPPAIAPTNSGNVVLVQFAPQAVGEGIYFWDGDDLPVDPPPVLSDLSGPSRLCFNLTMSQTIPLPTMTVADLLDWTGWSLVVPPVAQVNGPTSILGDSASGGPIPVPAAPGALETAIEFPYALFLAPAVYVSGEPLDGFTTGFASRSEPLVSPAGVVDLWSTSLVGSKALSLLDQNAPPYVPPVSAVWSVDYDPLIVSSGPPITVPDDTPEQYIEYINETIQ